MESGEWVTVTRTEKSMHPGGTMLIDWTGKSGTGSGRLFPDEQVPVRKELERVNDFDTAGGRSLGSEFGFFERRKWKASE